MFNIGDKLDKTNYTQGAIWCNENNAMIDAIDGEYVIVAIPEPTVEEQNEAIRATREQLYVQTSDKLRNDYLEAVARGSDNAEEIKTAWLESKDKIREENPYVVESD